MTQAEPTARTEQLANPFRPGNGVAPPYLAGRDAAARRVRAIPRRATRSTPNWALTGLRGTGKTVLLGEFAARAERAGWLTLQRELGDRHRDDARLAEAIDEDCDALADGASRARRRRPGDRGRRALAPAAADHGRRGRLRAGIRGSTRRRRPIECVHRARASSTTRSPTPTDPAPSSSTTRRTCSPTIGRASASRCRASSPPWRRSSESRPRVRIVLSRSAHAEPQPQARPHLRRADVPPRRRRQPRARRRVGRARHPAGRQRPIVRALADRRDRRDDRRLPVLPAVLRRLSSAGASRRPRSRRRTIGRSSRRSCTSSTSPSSRTASRARARPSSVFSRRWLASRVSSG